MLIKSISNFKEYDKMKEQFDKDKSNFNPSKLKVDQTSHSNKGTPPV